MNRQEQSAGLLKAYSIHPICPCHAAAQSPAVQITVSCTTATLEKRSCLSFWVVAPSSLSLILWLSPGWHASVPHRCWHLRSNLASGGPKLRHDAHTRVQLATRVLRDLITQRPSLFPDHWVKDWFFRKFLTFPIVMSMVLHLRFG